MKSLLLVLRVVTLAALLAPAGAAAAVRAAGPLDEINHVIVIYQENWSFDSLYGEFPGANGLANAGANVRQVDKGGQPYAALPQPLDTNKKPAAADPRFPASLPVAPYDLGTYAPADQKLGDLGGGFYQEQYQIDGGKMDK